MSLPKASLLPMGQAGFILSDGNVLVGIDLVVSDLYFQGTTVSRRLIPPPCPVQEFPLLDIILVTHDHKDHQDTELIIDQASRNPSVIVMAPKHILDGLDIPRSCKTYVRDYEETDVKGVKITPVPAAHEEYGFSEEGCSMFYGYILTMAGRRVFHSGDSVVTDRLVEDLKERGPYDCLILPINGRDKERQSRGVIGNMDGEEAIGLSLAVGAGILIPCHFDLIGGNGADTESFALKAKGKIPVKIPRCGESFPFPDENERELVSLVRELVRTESLSGKEKDAALMLKALMKSKGFDEVSIDKYGSVLGVINGKRKGRTILLDGHIDTVDAADKDEWEHEPFSSLIDKERIYGRGASDMKGSDMAMLLAAASFAGKDFPGRIALSLTVHEECFEGIAAREITKSISPDFVVIGEATGLRVNTGQRGRAEIVVETEGRSCHSSNPEKGLNAVYEFMRALGEIRKIEPPEHPLLGKGILELTDIKSFPYPGASVVPSLCRATFDRRLLPGESEESVLGQVNEALDRSGVKGRAYIAEGRELCWTGEEIGARKFYPAWVTDKDNADVIKVLAALEEEGLDSRLSHYSFCTNGSHYAGEAGIPAIGYGPSDESQAHVRDEYIEISALIKAYRGFKAVLHALTE